MSGYRPEAASDATGAYAVVWFEPEVDAAMMPVYVPMLQRFDAGLPLHDAVRLLDPDSGLTLSGSPSLAMLPNGDAVVALNLTADTITFLPYFVIVGPDGVIETPLTVVDPGAGAAGSPKVAAGSDGFVVSWFQSMGLAGTCARLFDSAGTPLADTFLLSENQGTEGSAPAVALLGDRVVQVQNDVGTAAIHIAELDGTPVEAPPLGLQDVSVVKAVALSEDAFLLA